MRGWPSRMGSHWRLTIIFWLAHWNIDFECQTISHTNIFSRRLMFYISTATGNYSIWNRLKSFTYPYAFSDFKSHFLWPEYCNQCLADKTDHLEWEVFNVELTNLNGKLVALDHYIPIGLLYYWFWISDTNIIWQRLMYDIRTATENYYSFSKPNVRFTWLQTTEQRAIMSSARLQTHLQTHGSQSNASKHDQLTNKIFQLGI